MSHGPKTGGGPRPKHVPQRMCVNCRSVGAKRGLIRLVRTAEGHVEVDPSGKRQGRGAYLCHEPACWETAIKRRALERALRLEQLSDENRQALLHYAAQLEPSSTAERAEP